MRGQIVLLLSIEPTFRFYPFVGSSFVFSRLHLAKRRRGVIERVNERRMEEGEREKIQYNKDKKREEEKRRGGGCVKATDL